VHSSPVRLANVNYSIFTDISEWTKKPIGGTNWQKYLPPKTQRIIFYPELWSDEELEKWGRKVN
jgi:hypothetical protein